MPDNPEIIQINYGPPRGQVGTRPRKVRLKQAFEVRTEAPGDFSIEFTGDSPFANGVKKVKAGPDNSFVVEKAGRFPFKCTLNQNGKILELGDPADPATGIGGELEVGC